MSTRRQTWRTGEGSSWAMRTPVCSVSAPTCPLSTPRTIRSAPRWRWDDAPVHHPDGAASAAERTEPPAARPAGPEQAAEGSCEGAGVPSMPVRPVW